MKLSDLQTFSDIVDAGGLTAAANRRGVTQPALSRLLRDIETRMQAQLLTRTGRGIELTQAGEEFLRFSQETLERFADTRKRIAGHTRTLPRQLRISVPLRVGRLLIPDLYRGFGKRLPDTTVHVFEEPSERAREMLAEGQLDAALTYRPSPKADSAFVPLFSETLYAVGSRTVLGSDRHPIPMQDIGTLPLLLPSAGPYRGLIQSAFRSAGYELRIARELETAEGLLAFAAEGEGVAILPLSNFYVEIARGEVQARKIVDPTISRTIGAHLAPSMTKLTASPVLAVLRQTMRRSRDSAAWRPLDARGRVAGTAPS